MFDFYLKKIGKHIWQLKNKKPIFIFKSKKHDFFFYLFHLFSNYCFKK